MPAVIGLRCASCRRDYAHDGPVQDYCPECGELYGTLECVYDYSAVREAIQTHGFPDTSHHSISRYHTILPLHDIHNLPHLRIGMTPCYSSSRLAEIAGVRELFLKDDTLNPTGSYKDRASAVVVGRAVELGYPVVACASTGNAAASLAGCCASAGLKCVVFVPRDAPPAKLVQIAAYGAQLIAVEGNYDQAFDLATKACRKFSWFNRSAGLNPYLVEGKKTGAFELCEMLNFSVPEFVFTGVGDGSIITGLCKGFTELAKLGLIRSIPKVIGVQAEGACALKTAFDNFARTGNISIRRQAASTCADSISVGLPREGARAIRAVSETGGRFITVHDDEIRQALKHIAENEGILAEPAGAAGYAGVLRAVRTGIVTQTDRVAVFITGNGLKDISGVQESIDMEPLVIPPDIPALDRISAVKFQEKDNEKR